MQTFRVLRCSDCGLFQVDIVKKAKKWSCKVCGLKQSVIKIYLVSAAAVECREAAQKFNVALQNQNESSGKTVIEHFGQQERLSENCARDSRSSVTENAAKPSKWAQFQKIVVQDGDQLGRNARNSEEPRTQLKEVFRTAGNESPSFFSSLEPAEQKVLEFFNHPRQLSTESPAEFFDCLSPTSPASLQSAEPPKKKLKTSSQERNSASQTDQDFWNNLF